jgi:hypothetical protein
MSAAPSSPPRFEFKSPMVNSPRLNASSSSRRRVQTRLWCSSMPLQSARSGPASAAVMRSFPRVVVREESLALSDHAAVPFDAPNVVVVAKVKVGTHQTMKVARTPPAERKPVDQPCGEDFHTPILAPLRSPERQFWRVVRGSETSPWLKAQDVVSAGEDWLHRDRFRSRGRRGRARSRADLRDPESD